MKTCSQRERVCGLGEVISLAASEISGSSESKAPRLRISVRLLATMAAVVACGVVNARAGISTVQYTIANTSPLEAFNVNFYGTAYNGISAGGLDISQNPVHNNSSMSQSYVTVSADFGSTLYLGSTYAYAVPAAPFSGLQGTSPAWNNAPLAIQNASYIFNNYGALNNGGITGSLTEMAALQLAVWMCLYDTTVNGNVSLTGAPFAVTGGDAAAVAQAVSWVTGLNGNYGISGYLLQPYDPSNPSRVIPMAPFHPNC